jgi:hypothetical protein
LKELISITITCVIFGAFLYCIYLFGLLDVTTKMPLSDYFIAIAAVVTLHIQLTRNWGVKIFENVQNRLSQSPKATVSSSKTEV